MAADTSAIRGNRDWRARAGAFFAWWTGELSAFSREHFAALGGGGDVPLVAIEGDEVALLEPRSAAGPETHVDLAAFDEPRRRSAFRSLLQRAGETRDRVRVRLARGEALVRRVAMPMATEENLRQVLAFEMDRLTPFRAEDVYFDYRVVSRDAAAGRLSVAIAVARREVVDALLARLRALGANVQGVSVQEDPSGAAQPLDLLPSEQRGERETSRDRLVQRSLVGAVIVLLLFALGIPLWRKRETVVMVMPMVEKARVQAEATSRLSGQLERQVNDYNFLLAKKYATWPVLAYVEEISRLLPDNTWVQQLEVRTTGKTREVQISGETTSSSKLIEIFEQSKLLQNATPRGTVTRGSTPNSERFMIAAETRPRPLPDTLPATAAGAPSQPQPQPPAPPPPAIVTPTGKAPAAAPPKAPPKAGAK
ncbi:MAG TPA: pilus assembly protein PilM [Usitatibacter sp.]|jgi:general secretion pathway protein L|nr:pilus assembly protein PilM [Usitatibacter sp.]